MTKRVFQAIDLDRTLFNTSVLEEKLQQTARQFDEGLATALQQESEAHVARGESFHAFRYLKEQLGDQYEAYLELLKASSSPDALLMPGAAERLQYALSREEWAGGIVTYGDPEGQRLKLQLSGLAEYPHLITDKTEKGSLLASWRQPDGTYLLPPELGEYIVDTVTLDDDKLTAFVQYPDNAYGVWITQRADAPELLPASLKDRVAIAPTLFESMERLEAFLSLDT